MNLRDTAVTLNTHKQSQMMGAKHPSNPTNSEEQSNANTIQQYTVTDVTSQLKFVKVKPFSGVQIECQGNISLHHVSHSQPKYAVSIKLAGKPTSSR